MMKNLLALFFLLFLISCKKNDDGTIETIPLAPTSLTAKQTSFTQVELNWIDNSTNEAGFKIERKLTNGTFQLIGTVSSSNITTYFDNNALQTGSTYVYRIYSYNNAGNSVNYSNEVTISLYNYPNISTNPVSQIGSTSAIFNGNISNTNGSTIIAKGFVWSTSSNPTTTLSTKTMENDSRTGNFTGSASTLAQNTTYYVKAYVTTSFGIVYGGEVSFKTKQEMQSNTVAGGNGPGSAANQLNHPRNIFVDGTGNIYVLDQLNNRVMKWGPNASSGTTVLSLPNAVNNFCVDASKNIYTADDHNVNKWTPGATTGIPFGYYFTGLSFVDMWGTRAVCVDASGNVFVITQLYGGLNAVVKYSSDGTLPKIISGERFDHSEGIFVDASGNIYVANTWYDYIAKYVPGTSSPTIVAGGNGEGSAANQLTGPRGVFVDNAGNIYVADSYNNRIQKWAPGATSGTTVAGGNGKGFAANQLDHPTGVFVDNAGKIYIADSGNNRIQKW
jgi:sugar lactone lactonase YvrE